VAAVFAIANQKAASPRPRTTQTVGLALPTWASGYCSSTRPAGLLTFARGLEPEACTPTLHDVLLERVKAGDAIIDRGPRTTPPPTSISRIELHL